MAKTALITGASSGLGAEFARQLAARGADLVLVARDTEALERFAGALRISAGVAVEVLTADLVDPDGLDRVASGLADPARPVEVLVNNAGFGLDLDFAANTYADEERHLDLHVRATMRLTHAALGAMLERGSGRIINVASVAAFMPRGTYGAVKAWVVSFSRWANAVYSPRGVTVTAVCPGFTHTNFHERLGLPPRTRGCAAVHVARRRHCRARGPARRGAWQGALDPVAALQTAHRRRAPAPRTPRRALGQDRPLTRLNPPARPRTGQPAGLDPPARRAAQRLVPFVGAVVRLYTLGAP